MVSPEVEEVADLGGGEEGEDGEGNEGRGTHFVLNVLLTTGWFLGSLGECKEVVGSIDAIQR